MSVRQKQDALLANPGDYKFDPPPDVSGGGTGDFDGKAFKKDLNHVFNP